MAAKERAGRWRTVEAWRVLRNSCLERSEGLAAMAVVYFNTSVPCDEVDVDPRIKGHYSSLRGREQYSGRRERSR